MNRLLTILLAFVTAAVFVAGAVLVFEVSLAALLTVLVLVLVAWFFSA